MMRQPNKTLDVLRREAMIAAATMTVILLGAALVATVIP